MSIKKFKFRSICCFCGYFFYLLLLKRRHASTKETYVQMYFYSLKDCLKFAGYYVDDALVSLDTIGKVWVPEDAEHGVEIRLHDLTDE